MGEGQSLASNCIYTFTEENKSKTKEGFNQLHSFNLFLYKGKLLHCSLKYNTQVLTSEEIPTEHFGEKYYSLQRM